MSAPRRAEPDRADARERTVRGRAFEALPDWTRIGTQLVHGARRPERNAGAVTPPIYQTSTFHYPGPYSETGDADRVYLYTRLENPTQEVAAELLRRLEGAEAARVFGSGMGAISTAVLSAVKPGDEVVALENLYGGTLDLFRDLLPRHGVRVRWVSDEAAAEPEKAIPSGTRLVYLESPTNPTLRVHDLARWAEAAHGAGALVFVDNTFATPINQRPLSLGVDLVLHSATKYLGGHADLIAGAAAGSRALLEEVDEAHQVLGSTLDPLAAFLLARGMRTLELRMRRHNDNGRSVSAALAEHPNAERVHYPGRASEEEEEVARRQMRDRGGMVSVVVRGGESAAARFLRQLRFVHVASSLGGIESLASVPRETSHRHLSDEALAARGIDPGLVRLSLGIEEPEDLMRDLTEALDRV
jgi:cystathionine beta-lyase/cystathionine gamma-synthase